MKSLYKINKSGHPNFWIANFHTIKNQNKNWLKSEKKNTSNKLLKILFYLTDVGPVENSGMQSKYYWKKIKNDFAPKSDYKEKYICFNTIFFLLNYQVSKF